MTPMNTNDTPERLSPAASSVSRRLKRNDHLHAYWSKREADLMLYHPLGESTTSDARVLSECLNKTLTDELDRRGYDVTTLRFSIAPKRGNVRFASQRQNASVEARQK